MNNTSVLASKVRFGNEIEKKTPTSTKKNDKKKPPLEEGFSSKAEKSKGELGFELEKLWMIEFMGIHDDPTRYEKWR